MRRRAILLAAALLAASPQEKKEAPKPAPLILFFAPLAVKPGETVKVVARGRVLDQATEVAAEDAGIKLEIKIKSKGKAAMPKEADPADVGDTQVEFELKVPSDAPEGKILLVAATPEGKTKPHPLLLLPAARLVAEKEQNGGFATAQAIEADRWVQGAVGGVRDVDVFKIAGRAGEKWSFEVTAARHGSLLDASLSFYSESGQLLASRDDGEGSRDPLVRATLPSDGTYYVSLIDAHDQGGGATHVYLLHARRE